MSTRSLRAEAWKYSFVSIRTRRAKSLGRMPTGVQSGQTLPFKQNRDYPEFKVLFAQPNFKTKEKCSNIW